jgi:hypothetical protein
MGPIAKRGFRGIPKRIVQVHEKIEARICYLMLPEKCMAYEYEYE